MPRPSVRGKIVQGGLTTFKAQGFNGCSIQDITEAAGVPKGSFFNHFKSKELLLLEVLGPYGEGNRIDMLFDQSKRPLERLRDHFNFLADTYAQCSFDQGCLLGNLAGEVSASHPNIRAALHEMLQGWAGAIASLLREAQSAGDIDPRLDVDELSNFLVNAWEGVVLRLKVEKNREPANQFLDVCFKLLLK
jgi:TetR/AcrR family transcriptional repressor of nem operon